MCLVCSSSLAVQVPDRLFLQSAKGYDVLQQVKEFMQQHILPAQKVSSGVKSIATEHFERTAFVTNMSMLNIHYLNMINSELHFCV